MDYTYDRRHTRSNSTTWASVAFYIGQYDVTYRELGVGTLIFVLCMMLSIGIASVIQSSLREVANRYSAALIIDNQEQFDHAREYNYGNSLTYVTVTSDDLVSFSGVHGEYLYMAKDSYEWVETKHYDENHKYTHSTWDWKFRGTTTKKSSTFNIMGIKIQGNNIQTFPTSHITTHRYGDWKYVYSGCKPGVSGTLFGNLHDGTLTNGEGLYHNQTQASVVQSKIAAADAAFPTTMIVCVIISIAGVIGFFCLDNDWLNRIRGKSKPQ